MLKDQDKIKELFSEKLGNFQAPVNSELWTSIASQIGATSTVAATGTSVVVKAIIGVAAAGIVAVGTYFAINSTEDSTTSNTDTQVSQNEINVDSSSEDSPRESSNDSPKNDNSSLKENEEKSNTSLNFIEAPKDTEGEQRVKEHHSEYNKVEEKDITKSSSNQSSEKHTNATNKSNDVSKDVEIIVKNDTQKRITTVVRENIKIAPAITDIESAKKPLAEISETPDVFTPNGDNANDELFINYSGELVDFSLVVLNMNNSTVFETKDPNFKWRGEMMNGELAPNGSYVYIIIARDANGTPINKYQRLTITR